MPRIDVFSRLEKDPGALRIRSAPGANRELRYRIVGSTFSTLASMAA